jgi:hypothetical protein
MKTWRRATFFCFPLLVLLGLSPFQATRAEQDSTSPTATYDPLVEPLIPENPTEYELGRNLYWHWCMTCHGDRGQGLTDEFRGIWPTDHQNCWGRGCHGGRREDLGFPIPTVVPALVEDAHLAQFSSLRDLADFLEETHPPQSPGSLESEEYHAIALFVFTVNRRSAVPLAPTETLMAPATRTVVPTQDAAAESGRSPAYPIAILIVCATLIFLFIRGSQAREKDKRS